MRVVSEAISEAVPGAEILRNRIPKKWAKYQLYTHLVPNDDAENPYYRLEPRIHSFELTHKGHLIYSRMQSKYWPAVELVADKCAKVLFHD